MKMNNNEKILLCILGILVVGGGYYSLAYTPLREKVAAAENTKNETENKYNTVMATIDNLENKKSDLKILKSQIQDCSQGFYPAISEEHIIVELNQLLTSSGLTGGINFEPVVSQPVEKSDKENVTLPESSVQKFVDQYSMLNPDSGIKNNGKQSADSNKQNDNSSNNASTSSNADNSSNNSDSTKSTDSNSNNTSSDNGNSENKKGNSIQYLKCSITFKGTYESLNTFLKSVRESGRKIIVNSLSTSQDSTNGVSGTMKIEIYSIPKIDNELESYLKWDSNGNYSNASFSTESVSDLGSAADEKVDFVLSAKPMSSDLPSLIIGKAKDSSRTTYVYADSNKVEDVEFILSQDGNKYYYKYRTSKGTYPKDFNGKGAEFVPSLTTSISINAFSESRLDSDDESGVKLKITNNTDMLINVNISGDDSKNPRITVDGDSSGISVNQK